MLITVQSNDNTDCNDFTNHFKQNVVIQPNSELALVNCSYNYESSITLTGANNTFTVQLGKDTERTITLSAGSYSPQTFLTELTNAISAYFGIVPFEIERSFKIDATSDSKNVITLDFQYSPSEWALLPIEKSDPSTQDRTAVLLSNADMMSDSGDGIILQSDKTGGLNRRTWRSGTSVAPYPIWATASDVIAEPHGSYFFKPQQDDATIRVCVSQNDLPTDIATATIQVVLGSTGTYDILEMNSVGAKVSILTAPQSYDPFDEFEIRIEQIGEMVNEKIRYFVNGKELTTVISATADRWFPRRNSKLICCGSFDTKEIENQIVPSGGTYEIADCLSSENLTITAGGSGYLVNEIIELVATGGDITRAIVQTIDAGGGITSFRVVEHGGGIAGAGETISATGKISGATNCTISTGVPKDSVDITAAGGAGTAYVLGVADILLNDGITTVAGAVNITSINGTNGVDDFTWTSQLPEQVIVGHTLKIVQTTANDCTLRVNAVDNNYPSVADVKWSTIKAGVDEPLIKQSQASFTPSSGFQALTGLVRTSGDAEPSLDVVGSQPVNDGKETDQMLINVEEFQIQSICKQGGIQKAVASVPYGQRENPSGSDPTSGYFFYESYNLMYHQLENMNVENHNQLRVRLTDAVGNPLSQLKHPTTITLDLRPRAK